MAFVEEPASTKSKLAARASLKNQLHALKSAPLDDALELRSLMSFASGECLPSRDALWCTILGCAGWQLHVFLLVFDANRNTTRVETAWQNCYSFADWHSDQERFGGMDDARMRFGGGKWMTMQTFRSDFGEGLASVMRSIASCDLLEAWDGLEHLFGQRPCDSWNASILNPHILVLEAKCPLPRSAVRSPGEKVRTMMCGPATGPSVMQMLSDAAGDWLQILGHRDFCHYAAQLHRRLAALWPAACWK
eukprot:451209-Amphidinium_carterae.1